MVNTAPSRLSVIPPFSRYAVDDFKKNQNKPDSRPHTTQSFPDRKSRNPFFIRNAPHPNKVRHIKGLLDFPVCAVDDTLYNDVEQARQKPPQSIYSILKLRRERFVPGIGMVNTQPQWFEELQNFTDKVGLKPNHHVTISPFQKINQSKTESNRISQSRQSLRTADSTRNVQSRMSTRNSSRSGMQRAENDFVRRQCSGRNLVNRTSQLYGNDMMSALKQDMAGKDILVDDKESFVFHLLTKILRTENHEEIKDWLMQAPAKEKETVLDMVRAISKVNDDDVIRPHTSSYPYEENFLYHESSLDPELYQQKGTPSNILTLPRNPLLEQIHESIEVDIDHKTRSTSPPLNEHLGSFLPKISHNSTFSSLV
ncbi:protein TBATA-like isoform X2 [Clytia hemisphaerica]|uniref:protein TBATA-like isoform X2 n=1 Tax=Clytia hemisphaerica TaxID=252671 RepID=UPI0034D5F499